MATITDVANEANVSLSTVSRVLNQSFMVSDEKRQRVLEAIEKLGYQHQPKQLPKIQATSQLIIVITSLYLDDLYEGIMDTAQSYGYGVLFNHIGDKVEGNNTIEQVLKTLNRDQIAGIIAINTVHQSDKTRKLLQPYPLVQICEPLDMKDYGENYLVSIDNYRAAYDLTTHLIAEGHKKIALITLENSQMKLISNNFLFDREEGFMRALREHNIKFDPSLRYVSDYTPENGMEVMERILKQEQLPDAVFCVGDTIAYGCIHALWKNNIPKDQIAICGFDNYEFDAFTCPALTSVDQSFYAMGTASVDMLHDIILGNINKGRKLLIDHQIMIRESTTL